MSDWFTIECLADDLEMVYAELLEARAEIARLRTELEQAQQQLDEAARENWRLMEDK